MPMTTQPREMHAYKMRAREIPAYKILAHKYKLILLRGKYDLPPNLWAFIGGTRLIPLNLEIHGNKQPNYT